MSPYDWIKALHLVAIAIWIGGMLTVSLAMLALPAGTPPPALSIMRRWNMWVTTPAMILTWGAGIVMTVWAGWWHDGWLWAKLVLVVGLTGLHGVQTATLRRSARGVPPPKWLQLSALMIIGAVPVIATLAVGKPF